MEEIKNVVEETVNGVAEQAVEGTTDLVVAEKSGMTFGQKVLVGIGIGLGIKYVIVPGYKKVKGFIQNRKAKKATVESEVEPSDSVEEVTE